MSDLSIGTISTSLSINLTELNSGIATAIGIITQFGATLQSGLASILTTLEERLAATGGAAQGMAQQLSQSTNAATQQTERFNEQLAMTTARLETLKGIDPLAELRQQFRGLVPDSELEKLSLLRQEIGEVKAAEVQAANAGRDMERSLSQAASQAHARLQSAGAAAQMIGQQMSQAGREIMGGLGDAVNTSMKFETAMRDANSVMGMTESQLQSMRQALIDLASDPRVTDGPIKLAEGLYNVGSAGFSGKEALDIIKESAIGAAAGLAKTGDVTKGVLAVLLSGIKGVSTAKQAVNGLVSEVQTGLARMPAIATGMSVVLAAATKLGLTFQDVTAAQATLTSKSRPLAQVNTELAASWQKLVSPTGAQASAMDQIGIKYGATALKGTTYIKFLEDAKQKMIAFAKAHDSITIGRTTFQVTDYKDLYKRVMPYSAAERGFYSLAEHTDQFAEKHTAADNANKGQGASGIALAEQLKAPGKQLESLMAQIEALKIQVGDILGVALSPLLAWAQKAASWFMQLPQPVKVLAVALAAIAGIGLTVGGMLLGVVGNLVLLSSALGAAGVTAAGVGAVLTGPVGIAIAVIVALVAGLALAWANDWGHIREHTAAFVNWIKPYLAEAWDNLKTGAMTIWGSLTAWWQENQGQIKAVFAQAWGGIKDFIDRVLPPIQTIITTTWSGVTTFLRMEMALAQGLFEGTWHSITGIVQGAWWFIAGIVKTVWAVVAGIITVGLDLLTGKWQKSWEDLQHYAQMGWDGIKDIFKGAIVAVVSIVEAAGRTLYNAGKMIVGGLADGIKSGVGLVTGAVSDMGHAASNSLSQVLDMHSPSRVFHAQGQNIAKGLANGIEEGNQHVTRAMIHMVAEHKKHLKQMQKDAKEAADALADSYDKIFALTHSEADVKKRGAQKQYDERIHAGVPKATAGKERDLTLKQIAKEADEKAAEKRKAAAEAEIALQTHMWDVKRSDAEAIKALNDSLFEDKKRQNESDLSAAVWMAEVKMSDAKAQQALEDAIFQDKVQRNQEELANAVYIAEVAAKDRESQKELDNMPSPAQKQQERLRETLNQMKENVTGILGGAFQDLFDGKSHQLFDRMLQNFVKMLEEMAAKALAMGIINLLTGGAGGFLGGKGGGGFLGSFGFDDATNDKKAQRWGFDFQRHWDQGRGDYQNKHTSAMQSHTSQKGVEAHFHGPLIGEVHNHTEADMETMADNLAFKIQVGLAGRFVGNG